jgi:spermidine synthase
MIPWITLDRAAIPGGGELTLVQRGAELAIRVNGAELMASRAHASEERMAVLAAERLAHVPRPRVLIGGLGLGYTLRATLDAFPKAATIVVAELVPTVVTWMRGPLAHLAGHPLDDPRAVIEVADAAAILRASPGSFHALLMDIDNSPTTLIREGNASLYSSEGLASARAALAPGGVLVVWSAGPDVRFAQRMQRAGFAVDVVRASAHGDGRGRGHTLFVGERPWAAPNARPERTSPKSPAVVPPREAGRRARPPR